MPATSESAVIEGLAAADVVDALTKSFDHRSHLIDLVSPDPTKVLFGPAVTVGFVPVRKDLMDPNRHSLGPAIYRAIGDHDPAGQCWSCPPAGIRTSRSAGQRNCPGSPIMASPGCCAMAGFATSMSWRSRREHFIVGARRSRVTPIDRNNLNRSIRRLCDLTGIGPSVSPYELRHTVITHQCEAGHHAWQVADWAGTSEKMIYLHYRHLLGDLVGMPPLDA